MSSTRRLGLPETIRMRHESHFVDQLVRPSGEAIGRLIPIEEMIASIAGRIARCFIAETRGVYRPSWTIEEVGAAMAQVHDKGEVLDFGLHGHVDHIVESFKMARAGG